MPLKNKSRKISLKKRKKRSLAVTPVETPSGRARKLIPISLVNAMFELYCDGVAPTRIAKQLGVSPPTVSKYVTRGDSTRGIESFQSRRKSLLQTLFQAQDTKLLQSLLSSLVIASEGSTVTAQRLIQRYNAAKLLDDPTLDDYTRDKAAQIALEPSLKSYETFHRTQLELISRIRGMSLAPTSNEPSTPEQKLLNTQTSPNSSSITNTDKTYLDAAIVHTYLNNTNSMPLHTTNSITASICAASLSEEEDSTPN